MSKTVSGFYVDHKIDILSDFDKTANLMQDWLMSLFGKEFTRKLTLDVRQEFEALLPSIPYIEGMRGRTLNNFLLITAQELAVYRVMKKHNKSADEAWELCDQALRLRLARFPTWKKWLMKQFMFSWLVKRIMKRREQNQEKGRFGDFEIEYLSGKGNEFDIGVNYRQCGNLNFLKENNGEEFAPYVCMSDIALGEALGWGLTRTQTLADGCSYCDFRFKEGEKTRITSKTPQVQKAIERINEFQVKKK